MFYTFMFYTSFLIFIRRSVLSPWCYSWKFARSLPNITYLLSYLLLMIDNIFIRERWLFHFRGKWTQNAQQKPPSLPEDQRSYCIYHCISVSHSECGQWLQWFIKMPERIRCNHPGRRHGYNGAPCCIIGSKFIG